LKGGILAGYICMWASKVNFGLIPEVSSALGHASWNPEDAEGESL
jgi:hypothetical protein